MARNNRLYLRLDDEELKTIEAYAQAAGISPANYCRQRSLGRLRTLSDANAIRQLVACGNNLNQIARTLNSDSGREELLVDLSNTLCAVRSAIAGLQKTEPET